MNDEMNAINVIVNDVLDRDKAFSARDLYRYRAALELVGSISKKAVQARDSYLKPDYTSVEQTTHPLTHRHHHSHPYINQPPEYADRFTHVHTHSDTAGGGHHHDL